MSDAGDVEDVDIDAEADGADDSDVDEYEEDDDDRGNRVVGGTSKAVLEYLAREIADEPDAVVVEAEEGRRNSVMLRLHVAPGDMGRVIGRRGRVAQSLRTVVRAAGASEGVEANVDIVD